MKQSIARDRDDVDIFVINKRWHGLSGEWREHLHEEIKHLVGHLVINDMDTLYKEKNHLLGLAL